MEGVKTWEDLVALYEFSPEIETKDPYTKKLFWKVKNKEDNREYIAKSFRFNTKSDLERFLQTIPDIMRAKHDNLVDTLDYFVNVNEASNIFKVIFIQEFMEKRILADNTKNNEENGSYLSAGEARKLILQSLNLLEYVQRNKLFFKVFKKDHFFITEYENFKISGLLETYVFSIELEKFPFSKAPEPKPDLPSNLEEVVWEEGELDPILEGLIPESSYKEDVLDLCICLIDILTLGKTKPSDLYNETRRRVIIDQIKLNTKIDLVNVLHFMCSDHASLRSDFVNLKKLMMNSTNKKSKEFKLERIIAEEEMNNNEEMKGHSMEDLENAHDKGSNENEAEKYLNTKISYSVGKSVKEYALAEEKNEYYEIRMEDYSLVLDDVLEDGKSGLFAVFDGHRGDASVKFVVNFLPKEFKRLYPIYHENVNQLFLELFANTDKSLREVSDPSKDCGSTACVCFVQNLENKRILHIANIGDTRAVLITKKGAERVSYDHCGKDPSEAARVREQGGVIARDRISGKLAVTRAFGDFELKEEGLISEPFINKVELETDGILVIASDGFWDISSDEELANHLGDKPELRADDISKQLAELAVKKGSRDNISVLTLKL